MDVSCDACIINQKHLCIFSITGALVTLGRGQAAFEYRIGLHSKMHIV